MPNRLYYKTDAIHPRNQVKILTITDVERARYVAPDFSTTQKNKKAQESAFSSNTSRANSSSPTTATENDAETTNAQKLNEEIQFPKIRQKRGESKVWDFLNKKKQMKVIDMMRELKREAVKDSNPICWRLNKFRYYLWSKVKRFCRSCVFGLCSLFNQLTGR